MTSTDVDSGGEGSVDTAKSLVARLFADTDQWLKVAKAVRKCADGLKRPEVLESPKEAEKTLRALEGLTIADTDLAALRDQTVAAVRDEVKQSLRVRRLQLIGKLKQTAEAAGLDFERIGEDPPTCRLAPFAVVLDFEQGLADLQYARESVMTSPLRADAIVKAHASAIARIRKEALPSKQFFDLLTQAVSMVSKAQGKREDERIELVELLLPLAILRIEPKRWRALAPKQIAGYPRYLLGYQLQRLRKDGVLAQGGRRLDLGTATGGSTRKKSNVLFVPSGPDAGQYYLSVRLLSTR